MQEKDIEISLFLYKSNEKLEEKLLARKSIYSYKITLISQLFPKYFFYFHNLYKYSNIYRTAPVKIKHEIMKGN